MSTTDTLAAPEAPPPHRRGGGRVGRRAMRGAPVASFPTLVRKIPAYEIVPDEAVELIHEESLAILEDVGCEFRDDEAIAMWKAAGADVSGTRVRFDRALLMDLVSKVPPEFTLHARNAERTVRVGGKNSVFVPMYGAPYVRDLDNNRRYGTLEDLHNFHKLAYMSPALHSSSSIICEPMEIAVPKRHLHIIHSALRHSDKPFMGIVTSKDRAEDTMDLLDRTDAKVRVGRRVRRIELGGRENATGMPGHQIVGIGIVRQIARHQRGKLNLLGYGSLDAFSIVRGHRRGRDRWHEIRHHNRAREATARHRNLLFNRN